jgi:hypothetical protein
VDGWTPEESDDVASGKRRWRAGRRRPQHRGPAWLGTALMVLVVGALATGVYFWLSRQEPADDETTSILVAPGGFQAAIGGNDTITVALEIRNVSDDPVTAVDARIVPPAGLTSVGLGLIKGDAGNTGFALDGDLPPAAPIELGTEAADRNGIIAARFTVDCSALVVSDGPSGEQIFVTIRQGDSLREEEITPPVVGNVAWLTATARRMCLDPVPTETPEPPLPPLPDGGVTPTTDPTPG